jgi:hypothetical protein
MAALKRTRASAFLNGVLVLLCCWISLAHQAFASSKASLVVHEQFCGLWFYWQQPFTPQEQQKIRDWLCPNYQQVNALLGPYLARTEVHLYRRDGAKEPVPWAYTDRGGDQQIRAQQLHFFVDPSFSLPEFLSDWTAVHEFSHLALPLLDRSDQWFAEGFASYVQAQIQYQQGFIKDPASYYWQKIQPQLEPQSQDQPMIPLLQQLMQQRRYKSAYWGSALWFMEAEAMLAAAGSNWFLLIQQYQQQHRFRDQDLAAVIHSFDQLLNIANLHGKESPTHGSVPESTTPNPHFIKTHHPMPPERFYALWQRYQHQPASVVIALHPFALIKEKSN